MDYDKFELKDIEFKDAQAKRIFEAAEKMSQQLDMTALTQMVENTEKLSAAAKSFNEEYADILNNIDVNLWGIAANINPEEIANMTIRDIAERIRKRHGIITPDSELSTKNNSSKQLKSLDSIIPKKYFIPNNKLANTLTKEGVELNMELDLIMNEKKEIVTKVYLNYDDKNVTIYDEGKKFTPYDRSVLNATCSIFEAGNSNFTAAQVYRCMNGLNGTEKVSPQSVGAVTRSLDKMRRTYMKIDCSDEAATYKESDKFKLWVEDYILSAKKVTLVSGNNEVTGYVLNNKPILYEYAQFTNQVIDVDSKLLNTKDVIRSTPEVIVIREYLIKRIEEMKNPNNNLGNKILFSTVFKEIGEPEPTKQKASKVRETIEKILGKYKDEKYIKDFTFSKKGRTFDGVEIIY